MAFGYHFILRRRIEAHKRCMLAAVISSTLFLASYLTYHFAKAGAVTRFPKEEHPLAAYVYYAILFSHTLLAAVILPLVALTLWHALKDSFSRHKRLARWTLPLWFYVSVTGVVIYLMLYRWFPPETA